MYAGTCTFLVQGMAGGTAKKTNMLNYRKTYIRRSFR